jgi:protein-disulfide isomerase
MTRLSQRQLIALVVAGAVLLASVLIAASLVGGTESSPAAQPPAAPAAAAPEHDSLLRGIPQDGIALGDPKAPVTLVEYADLQCPYCATWARDAFPTIVDEYVRTGKVRLVFRGLAFVGPDSEMALRAALAAGEQDALWNVVHGLYVSQGAENAGWVTDGLLRSIGSGADIDADRMLADSYSPAVERELAAAQAASERVGVPGTPFFQAGPTGGALKSLHVRELDAETFRAELDRLLKT